MRDVLGCQKSAVLRSYCFGEVRRTHMHKFKRLGVLKKENILKGKVHVGFTVIVNSDHSFATH